MHLQLMTEAVRHEGGTRTVDDLVAAFEAREALENPDVVLPLKSLRMTDDGTIAVPSHGTYAFTDWSRRQLASLLGVRWDTWFARANGRERADEVNRRLWRSERTMRLRTSREAETPNGSAGVLRAFVTPGYTPVADSRLARHLGAALAVAEPDLRVLRAEATDRTTTYVVGLGEPFRPGGDHEVGDVRGGVLVRNSGVGFASLVVTLHLVRLLCLNGMTAPLPDALLLRRQHRGIDDDALRGLLAERFAELPGRLARGADVLGASHRDAIDDVEGELRAVLHDARLPRRHLPSLVEAYNAEPMATRFGIAQALTRAAQRERSELRFELERAAGRYLAGNVEPG